MVCKRNPTIDELAQVLSGRWVGEDVAGSESAVSVLHVSKKRDQVQATEYYLFARVIASSMLLTAWTRRTHWSIFVANIVAVLELQAPVSSQEQWLVMRPSLTSS